MSDGVEAVHQPLHATDRRLDRAFAALTRTEPTAFLHCLQREAGSTEMPDILAERLPDARWIPADTHALTYVDPSDHLTVHQAWLEACHGVDRVAQALVRTVQPLISDDGAEPGSIGLYEIVLIDLIGTPGVDAVVVTLTPVPAEDPAELVMTPPPLGAASFRLRFDIGGLIIGGTSSVATLLGRTLQELNGLPVEPLIHPDDLEAATGTWEDVLAKPDQSQTVRIRLRHADGSWRWFHDTAWNALGDPDAPGILSEFHDIHALVEAEQALHASELGFRTLAESLPVGVTVLDQDGRVHFANHRLVTILTEAGLAGPDSPTSPTPEPAGPGFVTNWTDLVDPAFASEVAELVRPRDPAADVPVSRQVEVTRPDGQTVHLLVQAVTIRNHEGRSVIVSVQDVSDEVQTSRAHARLIQVVDEVDDVVVLCRIDDTIAYLNQAARRFLGDDAVGKHIKSFMPPRVLAVTQGAIEPRLGANAGWKGDLEIVDLVGRSHTMATTVSPVVDPSSRELHVGITMRDVTAERVHERDLARQARHDTLTDLPNRFALMELLEEQCADGDPDDDLAVFFIDLDNLKIVNDGLGHSAGDRLLVAVATELQRSAGGETVARFGGDEFVIVCEGVGPDGALDRAHRFLEAVQRAEVRGVSNHVSASIGVATTTRAGADPEGLIRDADAAMYAAKRAGRARCAIFDEPLRQRVTRRFLLEAALRNTIEDDALTVSFQPIVSATDGVISGLEALCRWDQGSPADFIPIAEESGLILPLGAQVLAKSLQSAMDIRNAHPHLAQLRIGINVSARELDQPDYAQRTLGIIQASGMPMDQVVLELTESVLIDPRDEVDATLRELRDAGVSLFALDDFGSGYSSLTYLRRYPLDVLKLDISYTQAMVHDQETRVIVETLVAMANRLGLRVVAEGVETEEQLELVQQLGVTWIQGYLVGRPAPMSELLPGGLPPVGIIADRA